MKGINVKTKDELAIMIEGGKKLGRVKNGLKKAVAVGVSAHDIEILANELIEKEGAKVSFKMVPGYSWATCINVNDGVVHGIPKKSLIFKKGDLVSVDVGLYYNGYHLDTSFSVDLDGSPEVKKFLEVGKSALKRAISVAKSGNRIFDISKEIETTLQNSGYSPVIGLVGHGIGKKLHEYPYIPCTARGVSRGSTEVLVAGNTIAVEVMCAMGSGEIVLDNDGWTIKAKDGKITGLFEDTIAITEGRPLILTESTKS